jgi:hypothetical protein
LAPPEEPELPPFAGAPPPPGAPPLPVELPFWNTMVPAMVGLVLCGVIVSLLPATQYAYIVLSWEIVIVLLAVVKLPSVLGLETGKPTVPVWFTVPEHVHPPSAASVQLADS